ncbi:MAG: CpaF family protein [Acidobacteria bacterium]|nr:CpaF family protein [Acidobacteriota bacterium]
MADRIIGRLLDSDVPLEPGAIRAAATAMIPEEAPLAGPDLVTDVVDALTGLGPIEQLLRQPDITDVLVNGPSEVWVERSGRLERAPISFADDAAIVAAVERVVAPLGLRIDRASPALDARLPDGSRLHAVIPPAAVDGPILAIRRFSPAVTDLDDLVAAGGVDEAGATLLRASVRERMNLLVAGGTGAGKTTLLNVLSREIGGDERIVTVEDAAELRLSGHVVRLEARPPNAEGAGEVTVRTLLRHALRLRPDRIVVGEVRGAEALDMIQAMNTGHDGSMSTIHANGPEEALWRLESLAAMADASVPADTLRSQIRAAIGRVVFVTRRQGVRQVSAIVDVTATGVEEVYAC